jgi:DNA-binding transcriptional LysR family regulator
MTKTASSDTLQGPLKVTASMSFGLLHVSPAMADFMGRYPAVDVQLLLIDRTVDLVKEDFDVAIRIGANKPGPELVSYVVAPIHRVLCASPKYLERQGEPRAPEDLSEHRCMTYGLTDSPFEWRFRGPQGEIPVKLTAAYRVNSGIAERDAVLAGLGIAMLPTFVVGNDVRSGTLRKLLPDFGIASRTAFAVHAPENDAAVNVRAFVAYLQERIGKNLTGMTSNRPPLLGAFATSSEQAWSGIECAVSGHS